jgi:hypothetical protein
MGEYEKVNANPIEIVGYTNFQAGLLTLFREIIEKFEASEKSFSSILQDYQRELKRELPSVLKARLNDFVVMVINDFFGKGGFYPKTSPFKRIPEDDLLGLCRTYFREDGFREEVIVYLMYCFYIKPFEYIKITNKNLENSDIMKDIPQDIRAGIIKDYNENYSFSIEISTETKQEMERTGLLPLKISQRILSQYVNLQFHDLSRLDKKILLDLAWSAFVILYYDKRRFTDKKFSIDDKEILISLAINEYLELYEHYKKK